MKKCPNCGRIYNNNDFYCLNDNYRLIDYSDAEAAQDQHDRQIEAQLRKDVPTCPTCHSTNVTKISGARRLMAGFTYILSPTARSQFECKNCGYKW